MKKFVLVYIFLCFGLNSCVFIAGKNEAEKIAVEFLNHRIKNGGFGKEEHYSAMFWKTTNKQEWKNITRLVDKSLGKLVSYKLQNWRINKALTTNSKSNGTTAVLLYATTYEKGNGVDTLTMFRPIGGTTFKIAGIKFSSQSIQNNINKGIEQFFHSEVNSASNVSEKTPENI